MAKKELRDIVAIVTGEAIKDEPMEPPNIEALKPEEREAFSRTKRMIDAFFAKESPGRALAYKILYNNFGLHFKKKEEDKDEQRDREG